MVFWEGNLSREAFSNTPLWTFRVDLHNQTDRVLDYQIFDFGLIFDRSKIKPAAATEHIYLPNHELMLKGDLSFLRLLPYNWTSKRFQVIWPKFDAQDQPLVLNPRLKVFTEIASVEVPFFVRLMPPK
jgi:hypothetical protein